MSGVTPRVQVEAPPTPLLCAGDPASWGPGSGEIRNSGTGAQAGPRRVSSLGRCTAATASSGSASPRAPGAQCHGGSAGLRAAAPTSGRWAAPPPGSAAEVAGGALESEEPGEAAARAQP